MTTKYQLANMYRAFCAAIFALLVGLGQAHADVTKIMPLGDSNTGIDPLLFPGVSPSHPAFANLNKYRQPLAELLADSGYTFDFVGTQSTGQAGLDDWDHEGHGGYRTDQILYGPNGDGIGGINDWLYQLATESLLPDVVLLMIGTNDILQGASYRSAAPDNLRALIDLLAARLPEARIIIATIPPLTFTQPQWNQFVEQFNRQITGYNSELSGIVAEKAAQGLNVGLADIYSAVTFSDMCADNIHLTATGFEKAARVWHDSIVVVPEPASLALLAVGVPTVFAALRRRAARLHIDKGNT